MYISNKYHILSQTLMATTGIRILATIIKTVLRWILREKNGLPDMMDDAIWDMQMIVDSVTILVNLLVFYMAGKKLNTLISVVEPEDRAMMGRLQQDKLDETLSTLPADMITKLLEVWASILVGVGIIQIIVSIIYKRFTIDLFGLYTSGHLQGGQKRLIAIYNQTHGFKYLAMMCALLLGFLITAIILENKFLKRLAVIIAILFLLSFAVVKMSHFRIFGNHIGVVWTSVIFHLVETVNMIAFAIYLRVKYKGV